MMRELGKAILQQKLNKNVILLISRKSMLIYGFFRQREEIAKGNRPGGARIEAISDLFYSVQGSLGSDLIFY